MRKVTIFDNLDTVMKDIHRNAVKVDDGFVKLNYSMVSPKINKLSIKYTHNLFDKKIQFILADREISITLNGETITLSPSEAKLVYYKIKELGW